jgi:hypothetical protein
MIGHAAMQTYQTAPYAFSHHDQEGLAVYSTTAEPIHAIPPRPFSWRDAPDLMARLTRCQNQIDNQDILTFAGFFTDREQLERHVVHYETRLGITA